MDNDFGAIKNILTKYKIKHTQTTYEGCEALDIDHLDFIVLDKDKQREIFALMPEDKYSFAGQLKPQERHWYVYENKQVNG